MNLCVNNHKLQKAIYLMRAETWTKMQVETNRFGKETDMKYTYQNNSSGVPKHRLKWEFIVTNLILLPVVWTLNPTTKLLVAIQLMSHGHNLPCQIPHTLVTTPRGKIELILSRRGSPSWLVYIVLKGSRWATRGKKDMNHLTQLWTLSVAIMGNDYFKWRPKIY